MNRVNTIRCAILGDGVTGKTMLCRRGNKSILANEEISFSTRPTHTLHLHHVNVDIGNETLTRCVYEISGLHLWLEFLPTEQIKTAEVALLCFGCNEPVTFDNVKEVWMPYIRKYNPNSAILLAGTKSDLKYDPKVSKKHSLLGRKIVTSEMGEKLAKEIGAVKYIECLAKSNKGIKILFEEIAYAGLDKLRSKPEGKPCNIA